MPLPYSSLLRGIQPCCDQGAGDLSVCASCIICILQDGRRAKIAAAQTYAAEALQNHMWRCWRSSVQEACAARDARLPAALLFASQYCAGEPFKPYRHADAAHALVM